MKFKYLIIIILFVLLILLKTNLEPFLNNNNDYIISMFLTGGLNEEAHNCIHTLKKVDMVHNLIVTCLDKKAYDYISKLGVKTIYKKTDLSGEADFGTQKFFNIMIQKIEIIKELFSKYNKCVVYTDTDIVFLKNIESDINKFIKSNLDIQIQDDTKKFVKKPSDNLCAGFIFLKPTKKTFDVINHTLKLLYKYQNNYKNLQKGSGADQYALNLAVKKLKPKLNILDTKEYPNGARYFNNYNSTYKDFKPKIIHNNHIKGLDNKIKRLKKHNLWFVKKKFSEFFTNNIKEPYLYGTEYGGFYLPKNLTKNFFNTKNIIYYGVGVGQDVSFDLIIGKKFDAEVLLIDPTPKAKKHYDKIKKFMETNLYSYNKQEGGGDKQYETIITNNKIDLDKLTFEYSGVGIFNSTQKFYMNKNSDHVSGSFDKSMNFVNKNNYINVNIKTIDSIMKKYNHKKIDILKLDIEGLEIGVLNDILDKNILPKIICVDFDSVREGKRKEEFDLLKKRLKSKNYYLYYDDNYDITFIRN